MIEILLMKQSKPKNLGALNNQKQPSAGVLIKRCSENILKICMFSKHLFLRIPLEGYF